MLWALIVKTYVVSTHCEDMLWVLTLKAYVVGTHCEDICCGHSLWRHMLWVLTVKAYVVGTHCKDICVVGTHCEDICCGHSLWRYMLWVLIVKTCCGHSLWRHVVGTHCEDMFRALTVKTYVVGTHCEDICCRYSLEMPLSDTSYEYHNQCFYRQARKIWNILAKKSTLSGSTISSVSAFTYHHGTENIKTQWDLAILILIPKQIYLATCLWVHKLLTEGQTVQPLIRLHL